MWTEKWATVSQLVRCNIGRHTCIGGIRFFTLAKVSVKRTTNLLINNRTVTCILISVSPDSNNEHITSRLI